MNTFSLNDKEPIFPIRTAAKLLDVSVPTLRMYEKEGLFIPFKSKSNQRLYSKADLERISLIRQMIREEKISINGIKAIFSLIPCWEVANCPDEARNACKVYNESDSLCWTNKTAHSVCKDKNCRECSVYNDYLSCDKIKQLLRKLSR